VDLFQTWNWKFRNTEIRGGMSVSLTNDYKNVRLLNLSGDGQQPGPFIVLQDAVESSDSAQRERTWLLRKDGRWVDLIAHFALPENERMQAWFDSASEVMDFMARLGGKPLILETNLTPQDLKVAAGRAMQINVVEIQKLAKKWHESQF
jgi:hypothetical protein